MPQLTARPDPMLPYAGSAMPPSTFGTGAALSKAEASVRYDGGGEVPDKAVINITVWCRPCRCRGQRPDHDGTVDEVEARQAASALFDRLDIDRDGTLVYLAVVEQRFKAADANHTMGNSKIDEFTSVPGAALVKLITYQVGGIALPPKRN